MLISDKNILYQDDFYLAVNKPSGLLVHRSTECNDKTNLLKETKRLTGKWLYPFQRLDRAVSGIVLLALQREAVKKIQEIWHSPQTQKLYLALARGSDQNNQTINFDLRNEQGQLKPAISHLKILERFSHQSLIQVSIETGRRHQIRRHLSRRMMPIVGDTKYGKGRTNQYFRDHYQLHRIFLHCHQLSFSHPFTDQRVTINVDLPSDLQRTLDQLRKENAL